MGPRLRSPPRWRGPQAHHDERYRMPHSTPWTIIVPSPNPVMSVVFEI